MSPVRHPCRAAAILIRSAARAHHRCGLGSMVLMVLWIASMCFPLRSWSAPAASSANDRATMELLRSNCLSCHNDEKKKGGLSFITRDGFLRGGENGPVVVPGKPEASRLLQALAASADPHMPPKKQLAAGEIRLIERWIKSGAAWDAQALVALEERITPVQFETLPTNYHPVTALALSPDNLRLLAGQGNQVILVESATNQTPSLTRAVIHPEGVQSLAWGSDGRFAVSGGFRRIVISDATTLASQREITNGLVGRITALIVDARAGAIMAADSLPGQRGFVRIFDSNGMARASWTAHADTIYAMDLSADGQRLVTGGGDKLIRIWNVATRREVARFEGHGGAVLGVAFNTNATQIVSCGADKEIKIWDVSTREKIISLGHHATAGTTVRWATNDTGVFVAMENGAILRYTDLKAHSGEQSSSGGNERKVAEGDEEILSFAMSSDGRFVYGGTPSGAVTAWNRDGKIRFALGADLLAGVVQPPSTSTNTPASGGTNTSSAQSTATVSVDKKAREKARGAVTASVSFVRDVLPVLSKAGCNAGACHAKPEGQNGFKLSVFSYDPRADYGEIVREARGRRIFPAAPAESLILQKPTLGISHEGGERFKVGSPPYELVTRWIRQGMPYQLTNEPTLVELAVNPTEGRYVKKQRQQLKVTAHYSDRSTRDVTALSSFNASDKEIASVDEAGRVTVGNLTGEGVVVARYMGLVADSKITVPADKRLPASTYASLPVNNFIDEQAYAQFQRLGLYPSSSCSDAEFLRRASLDAIGVLPSPEEVRAYLGKTIGEGAAPSPSSSKKTAKSVLVDLEKRRQLIDRLLNHPAYGDYWANKFADLLRPNSDRVGVKSVFVLDQWLRESFRDNKPYDQFVREILLAEGSNHRDGPAVVYRDRREPVDLTTMFSQLFLGVRLECAKCHHHPNEKWSQDDFYQFAAYFGPVKQRGAGLSPPISAGTETFYFSAGGGSVKHPVSGAVMAPKPPDGAAPPIAEGADPRRALADWLTAPDNPFFARAIVNRVWANFFGRGLVEPVDDFRISNPCVNPPLLDALAKDFMKHGCDLRHLMRTIMESHLYQLSTEPNDTNLADTKNFSRAYRRRLPAEVLLDAVNDVTGVSDTTTAQAPGSRAMQMWSYKIDSQFLDAFGRPNSSSDCPCERDLRTSVVQSLHLMHSKNLQGKLASEKGRVHGLATGKGTPEEVVTELYLTALSRYPTQRELMAATAGFSAQGATRQTAIEDVLWALLNSAEFVFNH